MKTNKNFRFGLPRKGPKYQCPYCGRHSFRRYIDKETGYELADECGICDHLHTCGQNYTPRQLFHDRPDIKDAIFHPDKDDERYAILRRKQPAVNYADLPPEPQTTFYPDEWVTRSMRRGSTFRTWLESLPYPADDIQRVLSDYRVGGTSTDTIVNGGNFGPAVIFWLIDKEQRVHDGKLMAYHPDGHRLAWGDYIRSISCRQHNGPQLEQTEKVFFGLHLLPRYPDKVVGIVESEKTALVCALHYPGILWIATGGCSQFNADRLRPLRDRQLIVFPDSGVYDKWAHILADSHHPHYSISPCFEVYEPNTDIADCILGTARLKA